MACSLLDMHGDSIVEIIALHHPLVLRHTDLQRLTNIGSCKGIEYTTPFTSIIPSLPFTLVRDFLRIFLEVKVDCIPYGLHILLIFSLIPLMYGRSTLVFGRHSETPFTSFSAPLQLLIWGSHSPSGHSGHGSFPLPGRNPVCKFVQLCCGGSLHFWVVVWGAVEVAICVDWLPASTCGNFASFLLHMEDRNRSFRLFLLGELDLSCSRETCGSLSPSVQMTKVSLT